MALEILVCSSRSITLNSFIVAVYTLERYEPWSASTFVMKHLDCEHFMCWRAFEGSMRNQNFDGKEHLRRSASWLSFIADWQKAETREGSETHYFVTISAAYQSFVMIISSLFTSHNADDLKHIILIFILLSSLEFPSSRNQSTISINFPFSWINVFLANFIPLVQHFHSPSLGVARGEKCLRFEAFVYLSD